MSRKSNISSLFLPHNGWRQSCYAVWTGSSTHCKIQALNDNGVSFTLLLSIEGGASNFTLG